MADLTGKTPAVTYKDLLQVSNSNAGVDGTLRDVEDGEGTASALQLSETAGKITGTFTVTGAFSAGSLSGALDANNQAITNINVDSGAIDNAVIGGTTAAAGTFTTLTADTELRVTDIDSNSTASINFRTSGGRQLQIGHAGSVVNYMQQRGNTSGSSPVFFGQGSDANVGVDFWSKGTSGFSFRSGGSLYTQLSVTNTTSANRSLLMTGSNGGAPKIATSAGDLDLDPAGSSTVIISGLPTSSAGLATGALWNNSGVVNVA